MLNKHYTKVFSTLHENNNVNLLREKSNLLVLFRNLSDKSAGVQPSSDVGCRLESEFLSFGYRLTPLVIALQRVIARAAAGGAGRSAHAHEFNLYLEARVAGGFPTLCAVIMLSAILNRPLELKRFRLA